MAILIHPMLATRDLPRPGIRRGDRMYHLLSDLPGAAGTEELLAAARACGMPTRFIQYPDTYREHFDIHVPMAEKLLARGARLATNREVGLLLRAKRARYNEGGEPHDERA
ncbi:MAG TPA: DUF4031 domain-containing protein [Ktedonobacterales bacterium]|jgi:hypothetical protein